MLADGRPPQNVPFDRRHRAPAGPHALVIERLEHTQAEHDRLVHVDAHAERGVDVVVTIRVRAQVGRLSPCAGFPVGMRTRSPAPPTAVPSATWCRTTGSLDRENLRPAGCGGRDRWDGRSRCTGTIVRSPVLGCCKIGWEPQCSRPSHHADRKSAPLSPAPAPSECRWVPRYGARAAATPSPSGAVPSSFMHCWTRRPLVHVCHRSPTFDRLSSRPTVRYFAAVKP